jgi:hypothetical protein
MDFHSETLDGLRAKGYSVGAAYIQAAQDGTSAHLFVTVADTAMPVEWAADLNAGRTTLAEIASRLAAASIT